MTPPFEVGDQVTVATSTDVFARATVLDCKYVEGSTCEWEVTVLVKNTSEVRSLNFRYTCETEN